MREIKFKAWDKINKEMRIDIHKDSEFYDMTVLPDYYVPMQFTGLKDKNGKEIYEGDILQSENGFMREVKWGNIGCHCYDSVGIGFDVYEDQLEVVEVIGNKHDNPKLIK